MDKQKQILQGLWRRAGRQDEPLEIKCASLSDARRMRFSLYNAVREYKIEGPDGTIIKRADAALQKGIDNCSVAFKADDALTVLIRQKTASSLMQAALAVLGDEPMMEEIDVAAAASAEAVLKKLAETETDPGAAQVQGPRVTPYYTR